MNPSIQYPGVTVGAAGQYAGPDAAGLTGQVLAVLDEVTRKMGWINLSSAPGAAGAVPAADGAGAFVDSGVVAGGGDLTAGRLSVDEVWLDYQATGLKFKRSAGINEYGTITHDGLLFRLDAGSWSGTDIELKANSEVKLSAPQVTFSAVSPVMHAGLSSGSTMTVSGNNGVIIDSGFGGGTRDFWVRNAGVDALHVDENALTAYVDAIITGETATDGIRRGLIVITNGDSPYTVDPADTHILCDCSAGAIIVDLPAAGGENKRELVVKKIDSSGNAVTIDGDGSETIDGATTQSLASQYDLLRLLCDDAEWWIV